MAGFNVADMAKQFVGAGTAQQYRLDNPEIARDFLMQQAAPKLGLKAAEALKTLTSDEKLMQQAAETGVLVVKENMEKPGTGFVDMGAFLELAAKGREETDPLRMAAARVSNDIGIGDKRIDDVETGMLQRGNKTMIGSLINFLPLVGLLTTGLSFTGALVAGVGVALMSYFNAGDKLAGMFGAKPDVDATPLDAAEQARQTKKNEEDQERAAAAQVTIPERAPNTTVIAEVSRMVEEDRFPANPDSGEPAISVGLVTLGSKTNDKGETYTIVGLYKRGEGNNTAQLFGTAVIKPDGKIYGMQNDGSNEGMGGGNFFEGEINETITILENGDAKIKTASSARWVERTYGLVNNAYDPMKLEELLITNSEAKAQILVRDYSADQSQRFTRQDAGEKETQTGASVSPDALKKRVQELESHFGTPQEKQVDQDVAMTEPLPAPTLQGKEKSTGLSGSIS